MTESKRLLRRNLLKLEFLQCIALSYEVSFTNVVNLGRNILEP